MIRAAAILALCLAWSPTVPAWALSADDVVWGCDDVGYVEPTTEYDHAVLGDAVEYKALLILVHTATGILPATFSLPEGKVYEDIAPRCADLDGDGHDEIVTVVSDAKLGASLTVYSKRSGPIDATPPIGTRYRWLAPAGIADFNGDGQNDVAYVETPHLGGLLRIWTLKDGKLVEIAQLSGFSNHRIGDDFITGGVRDCGQGPELVLPNFSWRQTMVVSWRDGSLHARPLARAARPEDIERIMDCG